jgi:hypothetical protein
VFTVISRGVRGTLVPRLTTRGECQLQELLTIQSGVVLKSDEPNLRSLLRCWKKCGALDAAALYKLRTWGGVHAPFHDFV